MMMPWNKIRFCSRRMITFYKWRLSNDYVRYLVLIYHLRWPLLSEDSVHIPTFYINIRLRFLLCQVETISIECWHVCISLSVPNADKVPFTKGGNIMCSCWHNDKLSKRDWGVLMCVTPSTIHLRTIDSTGQQKSAEKRAWIRNTILVSFLFLHTFLHFSTFWIPRNARWTCPRF